jgi:hypothetical protein
MFNQPLSQVDSHPYLGVNVDSKLSWKEHIKDVTSKSSKTLGMVKRTLSGSSTAVRETAYTMLVRPKLEYGATVWSPHNKNLIHQLERVQNGAARFVANDHRRTSSVTDMKNRLNWQTLERRRLNAQLIMFYKIIHNLVKIEAPPNILHRSSTRNSHINKFVYPKAQNTVYHFSFYPRVIRVWSLLPASCTMAPSLDSFKAHVPRVEITPPSYVKCL